MKIKPLLLLLTLASAALSSCKPEVPEGPDLTKLDFQQFIGHTEDLGFSMRKLMTTLPNDEIVVTYTSFVPGTGTNGVQDIRLTKYDIKGTQVWDKMIVTGFVNFPMDLKLTSDGQFIIAGIRAVDDQYLERSLAYLAKTSPDGTLLWEKTFGTDEQGSALSVTEGTDGNYYLLCIQQKTNKLYVVVVSPAGTQLGQWSFSEAPYNNSIRYGSVSRIAATRDSHILIFGASVHKLTLSGDVVWSKNRVTYDNPDEYVYLYSMLQNAAGTYVFAGESVNTGSVNFDRAAAFVTINPDSSLEINKRLSFPGFEDALCSDIYEQAPNDYFLTGTVSDIDYNRYVLLVNVTGLGVEKWSKTFDYSNGVSMKANYGGGGARLSNGSYVFQGITERREDTPSQWRRTLLVKWGKP
ncbi:MAG: hypothetical protein EAZ89_06435 [Bacteroidetes bacterium]|nr:MAG: hypothetical protein EAZ89_06435 [Bacteroidota bacterium]